MAAAFPKPARNARGLNHISLSCFFVLAFSTLAVQPTVAQQTGAIVEINLTPAPGPIPVNGYLQWTTLLHNNGTSGPANMTLTLQCSGPFTPLPSATHLSAGCTAPVTSPPYPTGYPVGTPYPGCETTPFGLVDFTKTGVLYPTTIDNTGSLTVMTWRNVILAAGGAITPLAVVGSVPYSSPILCLATVSPSNSSDANSTLRNGLIGVNNAPSYNIKEGAVFNSILPPPPGTTPAPGAPATPPSNVITTTFIPTTPGGAPCVPRNSTLETLPVSNTTTPGADNRTSCQTVTSTKRQNTTSCTTNGTIITTITYIDTTITCLTNNVTNVTTPTSSPTLSNGTIPNATNGTAPVVTNGTTPVVTNGTVPVVTNGTRPVATNGTAPVVTNGTTPVVTNGTTPVATNGTAPVATNGTAPVATNGTTPIVTNGTNATTGALTAFPGATVTSPTLAPAAQPTPVPTVPSAVTTPPPASTTAVPAPTTATPAPTTAAPAGTTAAPVATPAAGATGGNPTPTPART